MDEILNSKNLNAVRFRMAKPQGYYTEDVDNFVDSAVKKSVAAYEVKIAEQDQTISRLEGQIAPLQAKISELEIKADFADASGDAQQDDALIQSIAKQEELEAQILALRSEIGEKEDYITQLNTYIDEVTPLIDAGAAALAASEKEIEEVQESIIEEAVIEEDVIEEATEDTFEPYDATDSENEEEEKAENNFDDEEAIEIVESINPEDLEDEKLSEEIVDVYGSFDDEYEVDVAELEKEMNGETVADSFGTSDISKTNGSVADAFGISDEDDEPEVDPEALRAAMEEHDEEEKQERVEAKKTKKTKESDLPEGVRPEDL